MAGIASWKAFLSTTNGGGTSTHAKDRIPYSEAYHYVRTDGALLATGAADLYDGSLDNPINLDHNGASAGGLGASNVRTGTRGDGTSDGTNADCTNWTSSSALQGTGCVGSSSISVLPTWACTLSLPATGCGASYALYCFAATTV